MAIEKANETSVPVETTPVAEKKSVEYIKYVGPASRREITVEQWRDIGVDMPSDSNWMFGNSFALPKEIFPPKALEYLLGETRATGTKSFVVVSE